MHEKRILNDYLSAMLDKDGISGQFVSNGPLNGGDIDPFGEETYQKAPGVFHRYPDRVVFVVTNNCFAYCRFCFRKRYWNRPAPFDLTRAIGYLKNHKQIREVLISGGDPLTLSNTKLDKLFKAVRGVPHVEVIRLGTRALSTYPYRVDENLAALLGEYFPLWLALHVNHPDEITPEFEKAATLIRKHGIPMVSQTVLLKGINDNTETLKSLFCRLVKLGIKPYYLFGCDQAYGNETYRVSIKRALEIMKSLRGNVSGLCVPVFSFDLPNGGGKIVLEPNILKEKKGNRYLFENFEGAVYEYTDV